MTMKWPKYLRIAFAILYFVSLTNGENVIGNLEVKSPNGGVPSNDTGLYLMSQEAPYDGHARAVNACAFLTETDPNPQHFEEITLYFRLAGYRLIGSSFKRITETQLFVIIIQGTDRFGCNVMNVEEKIKLRKGDRAGVFVQQEGCGPFNIFGKDRYFCPAHVNIIDPVKNCSQSLYFSNAKLEPGNVMPAELNAFDGYPVDVFVNLDTVIEPDVAQNTEELIENNIVCATKMNETDITSDIVIVITLPVIASAVISIGTFIIIGVVMFIYCRRLEEKQKLQEKILYDDGLESDPNVYPQSSAHYHQADLSNSQLGSSFRGMHSVQNEYHTSIASSQRVHAIVKNQTRTLEDDTDHYEEDTTLDEEVEAEYEYTDVEDYWEPAKQETTLKEQLGSLNINKIRMNDLEIKEQLGSGQFATVHRGVLKREDDSTKDVAVKSLKDGASKEQKILFLQEAAIMGQFEHPNILQILAIAYDEEMEPKLIVDLMHIGDLRCHLLSLHPKNYSQIPHELSPTLLSYSRQVAFGMCYLSCKKFVHRDLAARNVLVANDGTCKIADFGLSRDLQHEKYYVSQGGKVPVKWTAPEALHYRKYSTASDVWSYGCLLYEIWSLGSKPFSKSNNIEALKQLETGYRLPPPPGCPKAIYDTMIKCWHPKSELRPSFMKIVVALQHPDFKILSWSTKEAHSLSENAKCLGAPLADGECLYKTLQRKYVTKTDCETHTEPRMEQTKSEGEILKSIHTNSDRVSNYYNLYTPDSPCVDDSNLHSTI